MEAEWSRILKVLWEKDVSANALANELGRSVQTFYDIKSKPNVGISKKLASAIHARYPDISEDWLLTGNGEMKLYEADTLKHDPGGTTTCERCSIKDERIALLLEKIAFLERKLSDIEEKKSDDNGQKRKAS